MKKYSYLLCFILMSVIGIFSVEASTKINLTNDYTIQINKNEKKYPNLKQGYFSCQYGGVRNGSDSSTVTIVFEDNYIYLASKPKKNDSIDIADSSLTNVITFDSSNNYSIVGSQIYKTSDLFKNIMVGTEYLSNKLTSEIKKLNFDITGFSTNESGGSICPSYLTVELVGTDSYKISVSNNLVDNIENKKYTLSNAGKTDIEDELDQCVKAGDCTLPDLKASTTNNSNITCTYQYTYKNAKYCAIFNFTKKDNTLSNLTIQDPNAGNISYTKDESIFHNKKIDSYINEGKCYENLYTANNNGTISWISPNDKDTYTSLYETSPITMALTDLSICNDIDKNDKDTGTDSDSSTDITTSSCVIDGCTQDIIDWALNMIKYVGIILVVVLGILDFIKATASGEEEDIKKSRGKFIKRLIACVALFLTPLIVNILISLVNLGSGENCNSVCESSSTQENSSGSSSTQENSSGSSSTHESSSDGTHGGAGNSR